MKQLTFVLVISALSGVHALGQSADAPRISTSGSAAISVPAYKARVTLGVIVTADNAKDAGAKVATGLNSVRDALVKLGLDRSSMPSAGYYLGLEQTSGTRPSKGYSARSSVRVDLTNLEQLGSVIDAALGAGASEVTEIDFLPRDADAARSQALELAFLGARRDAETLAKAAGGRLGSLISVSNSYEDNGVRSYAYMARSTSSSIDAPEVRVSATAKAEWRFEAAAGPGR